MSVFSAENQGKLDLHEVYNFSDPRAYFSRLEPLDYAIPDQARPIFRRLIDQIRHCKHRDRGKTAVTVLDLGCSYGVNAATLKHGRTMKDLFRLYASGSAAFSTAALKERDRSLWSRSRSDADLSIIGLDVSQPAIDYGVTSELLDQGFAVNLENEALPDGLRKAMTDVDIIISTGCVGYVGSKTFKTLVSASRAAERPWIASFVLRMFDYHSIDASLASFGYVTEKLGDRLYQQRKFDNQSERDHALEALQARGLGGHPKEADGHYYAEFYLSRPAQDVEDEPIDTLLGGDGQRGSTGLGEMDATAAVTSM